MIKSTADIQPLANSIAETFARLESVEAILLSGSSSTVRHDKLSDLDLYVYVSQTIENSKRKQIASNFTTEFTLQNKFWEDEDYWEVKRPPMLVEIIYRNFSWLDTELEDVLIKHQAKVGYTTCFWTNLLNSKILYDKSGAAASLKEKYTFPYPQKLKQAIIEKNYPILKTSSASYYEQLKKAQVRKDLVSINHRIAAFLASYFDILFALNEIPHPGEKLLLEYAMKCNQMPINMQTDIEEFTKTGSLEKAAALANNLATLIGGSEM